MRKLTVLLSLLLVVAAIGCQTNPKMKAYDEAVDQEMGMAMKVPVYLWDRILDLTDIVQVNLAIGEGGLFNLHASKWCQLGLGYRDGVCFGLLPRSFGMWYEDRAEGGVAFSPLVNLYYKDIKREALWGTTTLFDHDVTFAGADHLNNKVRHWADVGFDLHLAWIGLDAGISPIQAWDFVLGFFGMPFLIPVDPIGFGSEIDITNDDMRARKVRNESDMPYYTENTGPYVWWEK